MRELEERQPDAVVGGANRSTPNVVMNFMTKVYKKQAEKERFFVHVQDRIGVNGEEQMIQHVRELGSAITRHRRQLRLITNSMEIGRCIDKEKYDGRALRVCAAIDEGKEEKILKTHGLKRLMTVDSNMKVEEVHKDGDHEDMDAKLQEAWDDVSGAALDPKEVRRARLKEIQYIKDNKKVWRRIPRQEALRRGYKNVKGRWIDVNGLFTSTQPLEALRLIISDAAGPGERQGHYYGERCGEGVLRDPSKEDNLCRVT